MSRCTILGPGEGKKYFLVGDHTTFKLDAAKTNKAYVVAENWTKPGGGPPPHMHAAEDEMFYVLEGTMQFVQGDRTMTAGPGATVFLKRGIPHAFKNVGPTPAKFILTVSPSGFENFVMECGEEIDCIPCDKPIDKTAIDRLMAVSGKYGIQMLFDHKPTGGELTPSGKDPEFWALGQHVTLKLSANDTDGAFSVYEVTSEPGTGVPPHLHYREDEMFYVLEGTYEFHVGDETYLARPGAFVHVPKGVLHGFRNVGDAVARLYDCHTPGGFERFFEDVGVECHDKAAGPPKGPPPDMTKVMAIIERHGMHMPPPKQG